MPKPKPDPAIGPRILQARLARGISTYDLAAVLKVTHQNVQKWEQGKNVPAHSLLTKLAATLGIDPAWLRSGVVPDGDLDWVLNPCDLG